MNGGDWQGKQIVSKEWIKESTREHSRWEKYNLRYGYLWWVIDREEQSFAALGDGGNVIYVNPSNHMVVAVSSFMVPRAKDRMVLVKEKVEPIF